jgi:uncharacterized membrane protein
VDIQKLKKGYKLKVLISVCYIILLFTFIDFIFTYTPLRTLAYVTDGSVSDLFYNQLLSFVMYIVVVVFFVVNVSSVRTYRENIKFYEIKEINPNDPRVKGVVEPLWGNCGIWNPLC